MNKWQKVAYQIAKNDKSNAHKDIKDTMNMYLKIYRENRWPFSKFVDFKNWLKERGY